jgi:threonine/homoserine/homoserine lactone efflux protein
VIAAMGIASGLCLLSIAVALGLGQLFMFVPMAYDAMKYLGAAYLLYLAFKIFRAGASRMEIGKAKHVRRRDIYFQGLFTNLLNPKAILFFMAVLPQFTDPSRGDLTAQLGIIAGLATILGFLTHSAIALSAHAMARYFKTASPLREALQRYVLAGLFGYVAVRLALSKQP